jgi:hypothetical protein
VEKHTAYFNLLEQLAKPGCPICGQVDGSLKSFLDSYLYESVTDEKTWGRLLESEGYCARHCRELARFSDGLAVALFYRHLLRRKNKDLPRIKPSAFRKLWGCLYLKSAQALCPACQQEAEVETAQARLMRQALEEPEFVQAWKAQAGLCLPHIALVAAEPFEFRGEFLRVEAEKSEALCRELDEIVRKNDHRVNEKMEKEGDAWMRALNKMHGIKE